MTLPIFLVVSMAGGVGAVARLLVDTVVTARLGGRYPFATTIINVTGSFLLGVVTGLAAAPADSAFHLIIGMGLLGGYTTFSTASFDTVQLFRARRYGAALSNGLGMLLAGVVAATLGLLLTGAL